jgi:SEC-C motif
MKQPGRNEPCWCGSGRKFKQCCGTIPEDISGPMLALHADRYSNAASRLGPVAGIFLPLLDGLSGHFGRTGPRYCYMKQADYAALLEAAAVSEAMSVYWREMLSRVHFVAAITVLRIDRWLSGALRAADDSNLLAFAACFRGFLESCADSFTALYAVPHTVADVHTVVRRALAGRQSQVVLAYDLEEALIHFSHARRLDKGDPSPASHRAEQIATYVDSITVEDPEKKVKACYERLCQFSHPSALSVFCFADFDGTDVRLNPARDETEITSFCGEFRGAFERLIMLGVVPALVSLRLLNEFDLSMLWTPGLAAVDRRGGVWADVAARMNDQSPPKSASVAKNQEELDRLLIDGQSKKRWL